MESRPPYLPRLLLLSTLLLFSQYTPGQSSYTIDAVGLAVLPASTVESGTPVTLNCRVSVSHDNTVPLTHTFQLVRDDIPIYSSTTTDDVVTYELDPARAADSGSYECRVTVKDKSRTSYSQKLEVTGLQSPILYLNNTTLYEGDDFTATCSAPDEKGSLIFRFFRRFWNEEPQKMKQVAPTGNSSETTLVLRQVGDYFLYCDYEINLVSGTRRSNHSNEVQVMVRALHISPTMNVLPSPEVFEGDVIEVVCRVVSSLKNIQVFLTKDKRILKQSPVSLSHRFRAQEGDSGELVCKAEWGNVQKETYQHLTVRELFSNPWLSLEPLELFEGDRFILTCAVSVYVPERIDNETLEYTIYKNNLKITTSGTYITQAHPLSNGNYTCRATAGTLLHTFIKESPILVVKAKVLVSKPVMTVVGGTLILRKPFQLRCHSDKGTLPITYTLFGPPGRIGHKVVKTPEEQAVFSCPAIFSRSDLNKFSCHARNSQHKPPVVGSSLQLQPNSIIEPVSKPVFSINPDMGDVSEGQDMTLTCSVQSGTPPVTFSWHHAEEEGALDTQTSRKMNATFNIRNVRGKHKGGYYCRSTNAANDTTQSQTVTVTVKMAAWKKGLIAFFCILLILVVIVVVAFKNRLRQFKRKRTGELSVKSAGTKVERLSLTQAEVTEAANATPGMMGKSVWSEHVSGSESDDPINGAATDPQYTAPETDETDVANDGARNSKHGDPDPTDGQGSVEYAELNRDANNHGDPVDVHVDHRVEHSENGEHGEHGEHGDPSVPYINHVDETNPGSADLGE